MTQFSLHSAETAPEAARPILNEAQQNYGFIPNLMRVMAESPATLEGYTTLMGIFEKTSFDATEKQAILLAVSAENGCHYCLAAHGTIAAMQGVPRDVIDAVSQGQTLADERLDVLVRLTRSLVATRGWPEGALVEQFLALGYSQAQYLEIVLGVALKTLSNYVNRAADTPIDEAFAA